MEAVNWNYFVKKSPKYYETILCDKSTETIFQNSLDDEKKVDTKFALPSFDNLGGKYLS